MVILIFLISFILVFPVIFLIENAEKDYFSFRLFFDWKFYTKNVFLLNYKNLKSAIKFTGYFVFIFLVFFFLHKFYFFSIKTFFDLAIILLFFMAAVIDIKFRIVPDFIFISLFIIGLCFSALNPYIFYDKFFVISVFGGLVGLILSLLVYFFGLWVFKKEAIGMGDIKLFLCTGLLFGTNGFLFIIFYAFVSSAIFAIFYLIFRQKNADNYVPFVPFISLAVCLFMYCRECLYLQKFGI